MPNISEKLSRLTLSFHINISLIVYSIHLTFHILQALDLAIPNRLSILLNCFNPRQEVLISTRQLLNLVLTKHFVILFLFLLFKLILAMNSMFIHHLSKGWLI